MPFLTEIEVFMNSSDQSMQVVDFGTADDVHRALAKTSAHLVAATAAPSSSPSSPPNWGKRVAATPRGAAHKITTEECAGTLRQRISSSDPFLTEIEAVTNSSDRSMRVVGFGTGYRSSGAVKRSDLGMRPTCAA